METSPLLRDIPQAAPPAAPPASAPASAPAAPVMTSPASAPALPGVRGTAGAGPVVARIWITFEGVRWEPAGRAVPLDNARFTLVGQHAGFPAMLREGLSRAVVEFGLLARGLQGAHHLRAVHPALAAVLGANLEPVGAALEDLDRGAAIGDVEHRIAAAGTGVQLDEGIGHHHFNVAFFGFR